MKFIKCLIRLIIAVEMGRVFVGFKICVGGDDCLWDLISEFIVRFDCFCECKKDLVWNIEGNVVLF